MVCGATLSPVAASARHPSPHYAVFHDRSFGGRCHAGDRARDEQRLPRNAARAAPWRYLAHLLTRPGSGGISNYQELSQKLGQLPGVRSVTPAIYETVLLSFGGEARGVVVK